MVITRLVPFSTAVLTEYLHYINGPISIKRARTPKELVKSSGVRLSGYTLTTATYVWSDYVVKWGHVPMIRDLLKLDELEELPKPAYIQQAEQVEKGVDYAWLVNDIVDDNDEGVEAGKVIESI